MGNACRALGDAGFFLSLQWVTSHPGGPSNDTADSLAAATHLYEQAPIFIHSFRDARPCYARSHLLLREGIHRRHEKYFNGVHMPSCTSTGCSLSGWPWDCSKSRVVWCFWRHRRCTAIIAQSRVVKKIHIKWLSSNLRPTRFSVSAGLHLRYIQWGAKLFLPPSLYFPRRLGLI